MKRLFALLLCLCLCVSLVPAAFAEDTDDIVIVDTEAPEGDFEALPEEDLISIIDPEAVAPSTGAEINAAPTPDAEINAGGVAINSTNFPNKTFRDFVSNEFDTDKNGTLSSAEIAAAEVIAYSLDEDSSINSLAGIEYLTELKFLHVGRLYNLKSLDLSHNTKLYYVSCVYGGLESLTLPQGETLEELLVGGNSSLTSLDVTHNPGLQKLDCSDCAITSLNLTNCPKLLELDCSNNSLSSLDLSANKLLREMLCYGNSISMLDISPCVRLCRTVIAGGFTEWDYCYSYAQSHEDPDYDWGGEGEWSYTSEWDSLQEFLLRVDKTTTLVKLTVLKNSDTGEYFFGSCGSNVKYILYANGLLDIFGDGSGCAVMADYGTSDMPWEYPYDRKIKEVFVEHGVTNIGDHAFYYAVNLESVTIPTTVTSIGEAAFMNCTALTEVKLPQKLRFLGDAAFCYCSELKSIAIPSGVTAIGSNTFAGCKHLDTISIKGAVESIGMRAFYDCWLAEVIILPNSVKTIGESAFENCTSLQQMVFPNTVTEVGNRAFFNCGIMGVISFEGAPPTISPSAFSGVDAAAYYPLDGTWTDYYFQNYGGTLTWQGLNVTPIIKTQPTNVTKAPGETATFKVTATGGNLSYQWQYYSSSDNAWYNITNSAYSGAKTATMSVQATTARNGFIFRCKITNSAGSTTSNQVKLTVAAKPTITAQPVSVTKYAGETATFKVTASGATSYQWQYYSSSDNAWYNITNSAYSGAKTATMSVQATTARNGFVFRCAVTNAGGTVYTNSVKLTVSVKPVITSQPVSVTKAAGQTATFKVTASGATSYQWQYYSSSDNAWYNITNSAYSGAKTNTMSVQATTARNGYIFRCAVTNAKGTVYTNSVKLTVASKPTITAQPQSVTKYAGETASFKVTASGATSYQWQYYSETYKAWYNITNSAYSGAKTNTMSVQATTARNGYIFRCAVTNAAGTVYTNSVKLTVSVKPVITSQPSSVTKTAGQTATFKVTASGATSYQWQYYSASDNAWYNITNSAYSGAKTNSMSVQATTARNGFIFRCAITNANGTVYTNSVKLTVTG